MRGDKYQNIVPGTHQYLMIAEAMGCAQLQAWDKGSGYFYWIYKLLTDTVNDAGWIGWDSWDLEGVWIFDGFRLSGPACINGSCSSVYAGLWHE